MNDQELKSLEELHLRPASLHHASPAVLPETTSDSPDKHTATFGNFTKRYSSCSPSHFHEPTHKRAALYPTSSPCATDAADHPFHGFTKLQLPHSFTTASPPPLRRTLCDPIYSPSEVSFSAPVPQMAEFPNMNLVQDSTQFPNAARVVQDSTQDSILRRTLSNPIYSPSAVSFSAPVPQMPEFPNMNLVQDSTQFPNAARVVQDSTQDSTLRRTLPDPIYSPSAVSFSAPVPRMPEFPNMNLVQDSTQFPNAASVLQLVGSDPNSVFNHQAAAEAGITPLRPPAGRNATRSRSCGESPSSKRLKRIREKLKEIRQMCAQVEGEDVDEDNNEPDNSNNDNNLKEESENQVEVPSQEAVCVEKIRSILALHVKCPCGKGYQILLSGKNCYYKLTNF